MFFSETRTREDFPSMKCSNHVLLFTLRRVSCENLFSGASRAPQTNKKLVYDRFSRCIDVNQMHAHRNQRSEKGSSVAAHNHSESLVDLKPESVKIYKRIVRLWNFGRAMTSHNGLPMFLPVLEL